MAIYIISLCKYIYSIYCSHLYVEPSIEATEEGDAGWVDGAQLGQVLPVVVLAQLMGFLQDPPLTTRDQLEAEGGAGH